MYILITSQHHQQAMGWAHIHTYSVLIGMGVKVLKLF